ncbi:MAG TPA: helix-turn-helix transcriptional regulator [Thermoanaerobaculia bacterium]|nr:helix-turn-helix transcriptional regulator [Thermoanaerobaculia bacterium]
MASARGTDIREVEFERAKYGTELLIDVDWVDRLVDFFSGGGAHRLWFYDVLLVTRGRGSLWIDDREHRVGANRLYFTSPGQVRRWEARGVAGICLFFPGDFVEDFFNDPLFLHRLLFFQRSRDDSGFRLEPRRASWLIERLERMRTELGSLQGDSPHLLRAVLYEVLVTLNRWLEARSEGTAGSSAHPKVLALLRRLERTPPRLLRVCELAAELDTSPGHLNHLVRRHLGISASEVAHQRVLAEAKRRLLFSDRPACDVGLGLGFDDPSYFGRFFRRLTGEAPAAYREKRRRSLG